MLKLEYILRFDKSLPKIAAFLIHPEEPSLAPRLELPLPISDPDLEVQQLMLTHLPLEGQHVLDPLRLVEDEPLVHVHLRVLIR
jgi:hypothetical protein